MPGQNAHAEKCIPERESVLPENAVLQRRNILQWLSLGGIYFGASGCSKFYDSTQNRSDVPTTGDASFGKSNPASGRLTQIRENYEIGLGNGSLESHTKWPNFELTNQQNEKVNFYSDVIANRQVVLNFFYTRCSGNCPVTMGRMIKLARNLPEPEKSQVQFISVSLDSERETPEDLTNYANSVLPNGVSWQLYCGSENNVQGLRRYLGLYEIDEAADAIPRSHASMVLFGNDITHRWITLPAVSSYRQWRSVLARVAS